MNEELEVLKTVTESLDKANINYIISGSMAANYYSVPRMTRDIDVVVELQQIDVDRFAGIFQNDFHLDKEMIKKEIFRQGMFNLIHSKYLIKVDFIIKKASVFQDAAFSNRKKVLIGDIPAWFISAEDLILAKLIWAKESQSDMQLRDIKNVMNTVKSLDLAYVENWVQQLALGDLYRRVKA